MATAADLPEHCAPRPIEGARDWIGIVPGELPVAEAAEWAIVRDCGAVVSFTGTVRDHSPDRPDVSELVYEAYEEMVDPKMAEIAASARERWPDIGRIVLLHRVGRLGLRQAAVLVVVSTPHRQEAFDAARYCIDTVKATVPIWKREFWAGGEDWGACHHVETDGPVPAPDALAQSHWART
jgi:molybdopterin synthase catalytic subunit